MPSALLHASYLLRSGDETDPRRIWRLRRFVSRPPTAFLIFITAVGIWAAAGLIFSPWSLVKTVLGNVTYYSYSYQIWYVASSALLLVCFVSLPVLSFYRQSRTVQDRKASLSMKIISICWAFFGVLTLFQIAAGGLFLPMAQDIGSVATSLLFVLIAFALREPTILGRIVTSGETVSQAVYSNPSIDTIVLYNTESDRRSLVETFVKDGLATGQDVVFQVTKAEVPFYRAILKGSDLTDSSLGDHSVTIQPIEGTMAPREINGSLPLSVVSEKRELIDLDELDLDRCRNVIDRITMPNSVPHSRRVGRIWALNVEGAHPGVLDLLQETNPTARVIDLAMRKFRDQRNISLFSFSTKTSSPARLSDEQVLLPERDTSLLLDAVDKLLQALSKKRVGIIFDVFTDIILSQGFEKAYGVLSSVVEMTEIEMTSILVLINYGALEPRVLGAVQGLFRSQLRFNSEGLKVVKLQGSRLEKRFDEEPLSGVQESSGAIRA